MCSRSTLIQEVGVQLPTGAFALGIPRFTYIAALHCSELVWCRTYFKKDPLKRRSAAPDWSWSIGDLIGAQHCSEPMWLEMCFKGTPWKGRCINKSYLLVFRRIHDQWSHPSGAIVVSTEGSTPAIAAKAMPSSAAENGIVCSGLIAASSTPCRSAHRAVCSPIGTLFGASADASAGTSADASHKKPLKLKHIV